MIRYTTFKLKNIASRVTTFSLDQVNTSDSILDQQYKGIPYITDNFIVIPMQTNEHNWFSKEKHAKKVLCRITKADYELISFKKKQLDDKLLSKAHLKF